MAGTGFVNGNGDWRNALVVVFLRGGADGLSMVVPMEDDDYYRARPLISLSKRNVVSLNGFFGLNPALEPFAEAYRDGSLAVIHGAGSEDQTRSHFEAQDYMEHGGLAGGGWLGRYLRYRPGQEAGPLAAVAIGKAMPESMRGAPSAIVMESFEDFTFGNDADSFLRQIEAMYAAEADDLGMSARATVNAVHRIEELRQADYAPEFGAAYPQTEFGRGLRQIAQLIKSRVGLEAACIDLPGWDSHITQSTLMDPRMRDLARGLSAFYRDLGAGMEHTTVAVMTEFGRRVYENASLGTDHGRGSAMFVIGGSVAGGRVLAKWKGLNEESLESPGDLPVAYNYRDVIAPILQHQSGMQDIERVFPDYALTPVDILA